VEDVPQPLHQLMTVLLDEGVGKIAWIPFHMIHVLESISISQSVSHSLREVGIIRDMFCGFETGKTSGGDSWEALFVIALMIRLVTRSFHRELLRLGLPDVYGLSYNELWEQSSERAFPDITTMKELMDGLVEPKVFPHVGVYYPAHASFEMCDLIVVLFEAPGKEVTRGYQLKEGRSFPEKKASDLCEHSFVIRGFAAQSGTILRGYVASDDEIESFLVVTGLSLAPKEWRALTKCIL
jgi:hypothetical protein